MAIQDYLCAQTKELRDLVDEWGADVVLLAVVEYQSRRDGLAASTDAAVLLGKDADAIQTELDEAMTDLETAEDELRQCEKREHAALAEGARLRSGITSGGASA